MRKRSYGLMVFSDSVLIVAFLQAFMDMVISYVQEL